MIPRYRRDTILFSLALLFSVVLQFTRFVGVGLRARLIATDYAIRVFEFVGQEKAICARKNLMLARATPGLNICFPPRTHKPRHPTRVPRVRAIQQFTEIDLGC